MVVFIGVFVEIIEPKTKKELINNQEHKMSDKLNWNAIGAVSVTTLLGYSHTYTITNPIGFSTGYLVMIETNPLKHSDATQYGNKVDAYNFIETVESENKKDLICITENIEKTALHANGIFHRYSIYESTDKDECDLVITLDSNHSLVIERIRASSRQSAQVGAAAYEKDVISNL